MKMQCLGIKENLNMQPLYFYAPDAVRQENIQKDQSKWTGFHSNFTAWIAQTYFHLKKAGFPCEIAKQIPHQGILISDRDTLDNDYPFLDDVMLICVTSDKEYHPSAHLHIIQNPVNWEKTKNSIWNPYLIRHWPMPQIIPRSLERQQLVENISYVGTRSQLAPELKSEIWKEALATLNCQWIPRWEQAKWNNFYDIDIIVAARSFDTRDYPNKGAIKLINAWHAGVPALLTPELGFMAERKTDLDFIVVRSSQEAFEAISHLQNHPELYQKMVDNGLERAKEYTIEKTLNQWLYFLNNVAFPGYNQWLKMSQYEKKLLFTKRFLYFKSYRLKHKISLLLQR